MTNFKYLLCLLATLLIAPSVCFAEEDGHPQMDAKDVRIIAKRKWVEVSSPAFKIVSDGGEKYAVKLARSLEKFRSVVEALTNVSMQELDRPVTVFAIKKDEVFSALTGLENAEDYSGWFKDTQGGNFSLTRLLSARWRDSTRYQTSESILFHEYVHHISYFWKSGVVPRWYGEGLSEYLSTVRFKSDDTAEVGRAVQYHIDFLRRAGLFSIEDVLKARQYPGDPLAIRRFYAQSWLFVHYLNSSKTRSEALLEYLGLLGSGETVDGAFEQAFNVSYKEMNKRLVAYLLGKEFTFFKVNLADGFKKMAFSARKLSDSEFFVEAGKMALYVNQDTVGARLLFDKALELNPEGPEALAGRVFVDLIDEQDIAKSITEKFLDPQSDSVWVSTVRGHMYYSQLLTSIEKNDTDFEAATSALWAYSEANAGLPNVEAMLGVGNVHLELGDFDKALEFYKAAYSYAPSNASVIMGLIRTYYSMDKLGLAFDYTNRFMARHHLTQQEVDMFDQWLDGVRDRYTAEPE